MTSNPLVALGQLGQSPWYDFITRDLVTSGELQRLITEDGLRGMTTNPTIFENVRRHAARGESPAAIFEALAIEDVRAACDLFEGVYQSSKGVDGLVSMEVSPTLAHDTAGTIAEAERLWNRIGRRNIMIKIPGTRAGLPAITHCLAQGINVNVTLLFSVTRYREVVEAFFQGLEQRAAAGRTIAGIASVASFFVSRVDGKVDALAGTAKIGKGRAAIANACAAYGAFQELFASSRWQGLAARGAIVQRPLWASTSTKDPALPDVYYVEALIGLHTVNTLPPATFAAYRDHGQPAIRLPQGVKAAAMVLAELATAGIDLEAITATLEDEGVKSFAASFEALLRVIEAKAAALV
jgi:transaldolase